MKALVMHEFGGPEVLTLEDVADPTPAPGEVVVRVRATAVARTKDVAARSGQPPFAQQIPSFPHVLGTEHSGVVEAVGDGVDAALVGRRVAASAVLSCGQCRACRLHREEACSSFQLIGVHRPGSYAELCTVPAANLHFPPDDVSFVQAAALAANGPIALAQLAAGQVQDGSTVLVVGAGGALGSMVAALAAFRGARVIGVDRLSAKPGCLDGLPLAQAVDGDSGNLTEAINDAAGPGGVDCIIDNLGLAPVWSAYRPTLAAMGRIIVSGAIGRDPVPVMLLPFYLHSQSLIGVRTGNRAHMAALWQDVAGGFRAPDALVRPMPWQAAGEAHRLVEEGASRGQAVLEIA